MAKDAPVGIVRHRSVSFTTKYGHEVAGEFLREKDGYLQVKTSTPNGEGVASVAIEDVDVFVVGPNVPDSE